MLEELVVYGAVVCAASYATWRLMPGVLRDALAECSAGLARRVGLAHGDAGASPRSIREKSKGGCGGCTGCVQTNPSRRVASITKKKGN